MKIYVASSWRNTRQPRVVEVLRQVGHEVYDFRNPREGEHGFNWKEVNPAASTPDGFARREWSAEELIQALEHPIAERGFGLDKGAMAWADACVMVMPCGKSAHLELGWMAGHGKRTVVLLDHQQEPELMYKLADRVCARLHEVLLYLKDPQEDGATDPAREDDPVDPSIVPVDPLIRYVQGAERQRASGIVEDAMRLLAESPKDLIEVSARPRFLSFMKEIAERIRAT